MNVRNIIGAALITGAAALSTTSCYKQEASDMYDSRIDLLETTMQDRPQRELDLIKKTFVSEASGAQAQHAADSVVFRNIFEGTNKAQDSIFIADYNDMMKKTRTPITKSLIPDNRILEQKFHDVLTVREMKDINANPLNFEKNYFGIGKQYLVDSVYHHKLFEKHGLLDEKGAKLFKNLCKKVRP